MCLFYEAFVCSFWSAIERREPLSSGFVLRFAFYGHYSCTNSGFCSQDQFVSEQAIISLYDFSTPRRLETSTSICLNCSANSSFFKSVRLDLCPLQVKLTQLISGISFRESKRGMFPPCRDSTKSIFKRILLLLTFTPYEAQRRVSSIYPFDLSDPSR